MKFVGGVCLFCISIFCFVRGVRSKESEPLPRLLKILGVLFTITAILVVIKC